MDWPGWAVITAIGGIITGLGAIATAIIAWWIFCRTQEAEERRDRNTHEAENRRERRQRMPVLVVFIDGDYTIRLRNAGSGPAINIFLALGKVESAADQRISLLREEKSNTTWFNPIHLRPIPAGEMGIIPSSYLDKVGGPQSGMGVTYTDPFGCAYTMKTSSAGTRVHEGDRLPKWNRERLRYPENLPACRYWDVATIIMNNDLPADPPKYGIVYTE